MPSYFFPCVGLVPAAKLPKATVAPGATLHLREWETSSFDFATLGASHSLHFSWHLMDIFLSRCNLEIEICDAESFVEAQEKIRILQSMLYLQALSPFVVPFGLTRGLRDYSGINFRDSENLVKKLPLELQSGFRSRDGKIEGWLHEPTLYCISISDSIFLTDTAFVSAVEAAEKWRRLEVSHQQLSVARRALQGCPMIPELSSALLHVWQGIEALFPEISSEVTFRLALLIGQLGAPLHADKRLTYKQVKKSYGHRSRAAHGNELREPYENWRGAWQMLILCLSACLSRGGLPTEEDLTLELLG